MTNTDTAALTPIDCPFCGAQGQLSISPGVWREHHVVKCGTSGCYGNPQVCKTYATPEEAIGAWSRRASPAVEAPVSAQPAPMPVAQLEEAGQAHQSSSEGSKTVLSEEQKDSIYNAWRDQGDAASYGDLMDAVERAVLAAQPAPMPVAWLMITPNQKNHIILWDEAEVERYKGMGDRVVQALYAAPTQPSKAEVSAHHAPMRVAGVIGELREAADNRREIADHYMADSLDNWASRLEAIDFPVQPVAAMKRIRAIPAKCWWHSNGYPVFNNANGDDLVLRKDIIAAIQSTKGEGNV